MRPGLIRRAAPRVPADAVEDVVQETLLAVVRSATTWQNRASFATWAAAILRHKIADYYRARPPATVGLDAALATQPLHLDHTVSTDVQMLLQALPAHYRAMLILRFYGGLSFAAIAQELGVSLEAAKSCYRRATTRFREVWDV